MTTNPHLLFLVVAAGGALSAQSYADLIDSRNPAQAYSSVLQIEAGAIGSMVNGRSASAAEPYRGQDEISWDGRIYYRDEQFGSRDGALEAYAGRDGIFVGFTDGKLIGDDTMTRFEFRARPWIFYRDASYRQGSLIPNGFYEGSDYEGYIGFAREANDGLLVEFGPFYRQLKFERTSLTPANFSTPEDYDAYGVRMYVEQRAVQMDRRRGLPRQGSVFTVLGEREWNDSKTTIGVQGLYETKLPDAAWRLRARLEWYIPSSDSATWEVFVSGGWNDEKDRVQNFEGQRPLGHIWADGQLRMRFHLGQSVVLTPFVQAQYSKVVKQDGFGSSKDFFLGGGAESYIHFSDSLSMHGWYSYVDNENRPSISINEDVRGEHMFYLGMVLRLGAKRR